MKQYDERLTLESVKAGNTSDFRLIVERYEKKAYGLCLRMLGNAEDAADCLQDSFVKAYERLGQFRGESKFSTWLYRIVYTTALNRSAARKRRRESEAPPELGEGARAEDRAERDPALSAWIERALDALPPAQSALIELYYRDDLTIAEIAETTGLSETNAKVTLHRARERIRQYFKTHGIEEELR
ncbi:MAG: sigma-70 family RNA polymerase sigma factor [Ignavibacteriales bacterium]|nr:sigma-70 family RNA polymerase sigma factor [Ignavibacteriales bacterium]